MRRSYNIPSGLFSSDPSEDREQRPRLEAIRQAVDAIAEHPSKLGLDGLDRDDGDELDVTVDTDALATARLYALLLKDPPAWLGEVGAEGKRIEALLDQHLDLGAVRLAAEQADADLSDTDRWAGLEEQALQEELSTVLGGLLSGQFGGLTPAERDGLRHAAAEYLGLEEQERTRRLSAQQQTREAAAAHAAAVDDVAEKEKLAEVMLELRHQRPVDDAALDEALTTFSSLAGPTA